MRPIPGVYVPQLIVIGRKRLKEFRLRVGEGVEMRQLRARCAPTPAPCSGPWYFPASVSAAPIPNSARGIRRCSAAPGRWYSCAPPTASRKRPLPIRCSSSVGHPPRGVPKMRGCEDRRIRSPPSMVGRPDGGRRDAVVALRFDGPGLCKSGLAANPNQPRIINSTVQVSVPFRRFAPLSLAGEAHKPAHKRRPGYRVFMKVRDVLKALTEDEWKLKNTKGSHRQFVHTAKPGKVTVSCHPADEVAPGTPGSILKQAGLK